MCFTVMLHACERWSGKSEELTSPCHNENTIVRCMCLRKFSVAFHGRSVLQFEHIQP